MPAMAACFGRNPISVAGVGCSDPILPANDGGHDEVTAGDIMAREASSMRWVLTRRTRCTGGIAIAAVASWTVLAGVAGAEDAQVQRGRYLVTLGSCSDCHTPGYFLGRADTSRFLGGSDVGLGVPGLGVFLGRNLTPDNETGLGSWTQDEIVTAITTGMRPDGRLLSPAMPWRALAQLTKADAFAIAAYLKSLPPVSHAVPGPFGPSEAVPVAVLEVLPAAVHNALAPGAAAAPAIE